MAGRAKLVLTSDGVADFGQLIAMKLDQRVAGLTMQMVVLGIAVVMLIDSPAAEDHFAEQTGIDQLRQGAIDGRPTHTAMFFGVRQVGEQLIGIEVLVALRHLLDDDPSLLSDTLATALQELFETLQRRQGYLNIHQAKI